MKAGSAAGRLAFPVLTTLASDEGTAPFVDSILDLVSTALGETAGLTAPPLSRGQRTLEEIKRHTLARLATPDLSPASVAQACFVPSRQLHRLFERDGTTFGTFVKNARLARIQQDLTDPAMASLTTAESDTATVVASPLCSPAPSRSATARGRESSACLAPKSRGEARDETTIAAGDLAAAITRIKQET